MKPFIFVRTVVVYGEDEEDAKDNLFEALEEQDLLDTGNWACDGLSTEFPEIDIE